MAKKRYNQDDEFNEDEMDATGKLSGQDSLFDKIGTEDEEDDFEDDNNTLIEDDDFLTEKKSEAYNDDFDVDKAKEQKKKKRIATVKPKLIGKHSLSYDTIFKGKKTSNEPLENEHIIPGIGGGFDLNEDSMEFNETRNNIEHQTNLKIQQEVYNILKDNSDINFLANRRKPSASDCNAYFKILIAHLAPYGFGKCDIFIELSNYFSDNTYSIFLLLHSEYKNMIIAELKEKYGLSDMDKINFLT